MELGSEIRIFEDCVLLYLSHRIYVIDGRNFLKFGANYLITRIAMNENPGHHLIILFEVKQLVYYLQEPH